MATTNLNIRTDKAIKDQAEEIFNELGLNMTTAAAIEEGRKMMNDPSVYLSPAVNPSSFFFL